MRRQQQMNLPLTESATTLVTLDEIHSIISIHKEGNIVCMPLLSKYVDKPLT